MAYVTTPIQHSSQWIFNNDVISDRYDLPFSPNTYRNNHWNACGIESKIVLSNQVKHQSTTQSATQLCYLDNSTKELLSNNVLDSQIDCYTLKQNNRQFSKFPAELSQHHSMIDLDTSPRLNKPDSLMSNSRHSTDWRHTGPQAFKWLRRDSTMMDSSQSVHSGNSSAFLRFGIQDLIQRERYTAPVHYATDQPSCLVKIECRKPGCRCVLKDEAALALKIITGVTLVQGSWIFNKNDKSLKQKLEKTISGSFSHSREHPGSVDLEPNNQRTTNHLNIHRLHGGNSVEAMSAPVILSSCCPSWFEILYKTSIGPVDDTPCICPEVPVWSSGKALWRARPNLFLLRKQTQCLFASADQSVLLNASDIYKLGQQIINMDAEHSITLKHGTVLQLIDCRLCRLIRGEGSHGMNSTVGIIGKHRVKTASMLQCAVVGAKALTSMSAAASDLSTQDAFKWFADGPRLVYIPLDSKSLCCSPVSSDAISSEKNVRLEQKASSQTKMAGLHSLISLLRQFRFPVIARSAICLHQNEWFPLQKTYTPNATAFGASSDSNMLHNQPMIQFDSCYHGDLVFLEPLADCSNANRNLTKKSGDFTSTTNSRFFVVTPDMLACHNFFVAEPSSNMQYIHQLETHATKVSHFLAAGHPAHGLAYLLKHLENITQSSCTGPSHTPLSRTLGPVDSGKSYSAVQSTVASLAAIAALATDEVDDWSTNPAYAAELPGTNLAADSGNNRCSLSSSVHFQHSAMGTPTATYSNLSSSLLDSESDQMNALCDELEDIYFYVRNGRFPTYSRSMISLTHQTVPYGRKDSMPQSSAPISPQPFELAASRRRYHKRSDEKRMDPDTRQFSHHSKVHSNSPIRLCNSPQAFSFKKMSNDHMPSRHQINLSNRRHQCELVNHTPINAIPKLGYVQQQQCTPFTLSNTFDRSVQGPIFKSDLRQTPVCSIAYSSGVECKTAHEIPKVYTNTKILNMSSLANVRQSIGQTTVSVHPRPGGDKLQTTCVPERSLTLQRTASAKPSPYPADFVNVHPFLPGEMPQKVLLVCKNEKEKINSTLTNSPYNALPSTSKPGSTFVIATNQAVDRDVNRASDTAAVHRFVKATNALTNISVPPQISPMRTFNLRVVPENRPSAFRENIISQRSEVHFSKPPVENVKDVVAHCLNIHPPNYTDGNSSALRNHQPPYNIPKNVIPINAHVIHGNGQTCTPGSEHLSYNSIIPPKMSTIRTVGPPPIPQTNSEKFTQPRRSSFHRIPLPPTPNSTPGDKQLSWIQDLSPTTSWLHTSNLQLSQHGNDLTNSSPDTGIGIESSLEVNMNNGCVGMQSRCPWKTDSLYVDLSEPVTRFFSSNANGVQTHETLYHHP